MGKTCAFQSCRTNKGRYQYEYGVSCFRFPKQEDLNALWTQAINRGPEWKPSKDMRVCEKHFSIEDLLLYNGMTRVKPGAIPKEFVDKIDPVFIKGRPQRCKNILPEPDYSIYCRFCAHPQDETSEFKYLSDELLEKVVSFLPGLKTNDGLQRNICACCLKKVKEIIHFKEQFEIAEEKLLEIQKQNELFETVKVKAEELEEMEIEQDVPPVDIQFEEVNLPPSYENRPAGSRTKFFLEEVELIKDKDPPYNCPYCEKVVNTKVGFRLHILYIHKNHSTKNYKKMEKFGVFGSKGNPGVLFPCPACQSTFKQKKDLVEHIKTHNITDEEQLQKVEEKLNRFAKVSESIHNKKCKLCGQKCKNKINLEQHMKRIHMNVKNYECDLCNKKYYSK